jgi:hypothetical protein
MLLGIAFFSHQVGGVASAIINLPIVEQLVQRLAPRPA